MNAILKVESQINKVSMFSIDAKYVTKVLVDETEEGFNKPKSEKEVKFSYNTHSKILTVLDICEEVNVEYQK